MWKKCVLQGNSSLRDVKTRIPEKSLVFSNPTSKYPFKKIYIEHTAPKSCVLWISLSCRVQCSIRRDCHVASSWPLLASWLSKNRPDILVRVLSGHAKTWWSYSHSVSPCCCFYYHYCHLARGNPIFSRIVSSIFIGFSFPIEESDIWWYVVKCFVGSESCFTEGQMLVNR